MIMWKQLLLLVAAVASTSSFRTRKNLLGASLWEISRLDDEFSKLDLNNYFKYILEDFREDMSKGIPEYNIPVMDPFYHPYMNSSISKSGGVTIKIEVSDMEVTGLSKFEIEELNLNLKNLNFSMRLKVPVLRITGYYILSGKVLWVLPASGNGSFWVEAKNLTVGAKASLNMSNEETLQVSDNLEFDIQFDDVQLNFENLLGGGKVADILQGLINTFGKQLFGLILPSVKSQLKDSLLTQINGELKKLPIKALIPGSSANEYIDQLLENLAHNEKFNFLDPLSLPDFNRNFSTKVFGITFYGETKAFNGTLNGISTLHRVGNCSLAATNRTIIITAHLGIYNVSIAYTAHAKMNDIGPTIQASGKIEKLTFIFKLSQSNKRNSRPTLEEFELLEMSRIVIKLTGLGLITFMNTVIINSWVIFLKPIIKARMTVQIRDAINKQFQNVTLPIG